MSKIDVVRAAMVQAMKAKDKARKDSLSTRKPSNSKTSF